MIKNQQIGSNWVLRELQNILKNCTCACVIILFWLIVTPPKKSYAPSLVYEILPPLCVRMLQMENFFLAFVRKKHNPPNFTLKCLLVP